MSVDTQKRILMKAAELFNAKGYRSVTLDELASGLGMSKKTLYQYFSGKEELAASVLDQKMQRIADSIENVPRYKEDPLQTLEDVFVVVKQEMMLLNPLFLEDVQKYVPGLWERIESFRARQLTFVEETFKEAREAGVVREVDPRLMAVLLIENIQQFVRPDFAAKHGFVIADIADTLFTTFVENMRLS